MQEQPIGESPIEHEHNEDWSVLMTLLTENEGPWSAAELQLGLGKPNDKIWVTDSLSRLRRGGLIHRTSDDLIFPTRAAIYFDQIHG
jgi:hypothetical protein